MAHNFAVLALILAAVAGFASAQGPSAAPAYAPTTSATASPSISETPEASTITAPPTTSAAAGPSISEAPESSSFPDIASPPAPSSEATEGPITDFFAPVEAPVADTLAEAPESSGVALKVSVMVGAAAVAGSLLI